MATEESKAITYTQPISITQLSEFLSEFLKVPMADVLIEVFLTNVDSQTLRIKQEGSEGWKIYASPKEDISASIVLSVRPDLSFPSVILTCYDGLIKDIPAGGWINAFCGEIAYITASAKRTGVWAAGRGDQLTFGLSIHFIRGIVLPSNRGLWLIHLLDNVASLAAKRYSDISQQPRFWSEEIPESLRPPTEEDSIDTD